MAEKKDDVYLKIKQDLVKGLEDQLETVPKDHANRDGIYSNIMTGYGTAMNTLSATLMESENLELRALGYELLDFQVIYRKLKTKEWFGKD